MASEVLKGVALSTLGVTVRYGVETTAGTKPAAFATVIPDIKSVPALNASPESIDATPLCNTEYKEYVPGLKDLGGAQTFTANLTTQLITIWEAMIAEQDTAKAAGKRLWFEIVVPDLTNAVFFQGEASPLGAPAMEVNSVLEIELYITPTNEPAWGAKIVA